MKQGHRKLSAALAALLSGEVAGQDVIQWIWGGFATYSQAHDVPLGPMPDNVATGLFTLGAAFVWYITREDEVR